MRETRSLSEPRPLRPDYLAANPAGCAELVTFVALLKAPLVVSALKPEILLDALFDT